jgi:hypothetical protein
MQRANSFWAALSLTLTLLVPSVPAEASEVVKLARLMITGKRLSNADITRSNSSAAQHGSQVGNEVRHGGDDVLGAADGQRQFRPI